MFLLDRRKLMTIAAASAASSLVPRALSAGQAKAGIFTADEAGLLVVSTAQAKTKTFTADEAGLLVDSVVIVGQESAVLIDTQFTAANATKLADMIEATGRKLETILITHYHPDHIFGLPIFLERFPDAKAVAHPKIQALIAQVAQPMFDKITGSAPAGVFADKVVIPEPLTTNHFNLEGERIEVLDPMHGDTPLITPAHIPALDTLIAADVAYIDTHLWLEENSKPESIAAWRESIAALKAIGASTVIPGHRKETSPCDASVFKATLAYLDHWEAAIAKSSNAEELKAALVEGHEDYGFGFAIDRAVGAVYPAK